MHLMHVGTLSSVNRLPEFDARAGFLLVSRIAASAVVSSISMKPAGSVQ